MDPRKIREAEEAKAQLRAKYQATIRHMADWIFAGRKGEPFDELGRPRRILKETK